MIASGFGEGIVILLQHGANALIHIDIFQARAR
jgi:hypothetical protein